MRALWHLPPVPAVLERALEGLVAIDEWLLQRGLVPRLYASGVKYRWKLPGNGWDHAAIVAARGSGDCKDVSAWRVAEQRLAGLDAWPHIIHTGGRNYHVQVRYADGRIEDPSAVLLRAEKGQHANRHR
jgi:hypothetical protein